MMTGAEKLVPTEVDHRHGSTSEVLLLGREVQGLLAMHVGYQDECGGGGRQSAGNAGYLTLERSSPEYSKGRVQLEVSLSTSIIFDTQPDEDPDAIDADLTAYEV